MSAIILLLIEPQMGFAGFEDLWNPDLVIPALAAGAAFVLLAMLDRAGALLPVLVSEPAALSTGTIAFILTRVGSL